jgi:hypothetical protein
MRQAATESVHHLAASSSGITLQSEILTALRASALNVAKSTG